MSLPPSTPTPCPLATSARSDLDPSHTATGEPQGILRRAGPGYAPDAADSERINATLLALVRNEELSGMLQAMRDLERTWNHKFNYPWTFFNDVPFTEEFKKKTSEVTKAETRYGKRKLSPLCLTYDRGIY